MNNSLIETFVRVRTGLSLLPHLKLNRSSQRLKQKLLSGVVVCSIFLSQLLSIFVPSVYAATSPFTQTDWSGGSGQTNFTDTTKYSSGTAVDTSSVTGQTTLTKNEKLSNTGFESDLASWTSSANSFSDSTFANASGAVAAWPLDDTTSTQSFARVVNPYLSEGRTLFADGDMESSTTSSWSVSSGDTITKETASPHGGTRYLRVTLGTNGNVFAANQSNSATNGKTYRIRGWYRGDGTSNPRIAKASSGAAIVTGTTSTSWQSFDVYATADSSTGFILRGNNNGAAGGTYVEFDDVSVVQVNIPATPVATATELLTDGNMEAAGTGSWTPGGFAALSKQTTSPHGGSQVLRVANDGSHTSANANQSSLTAGVVYRATGYMRSDGTSTPRVLNNSSTAIVTGTSSTTWQPFDVVFVAAGTTINFQASLSVAGSGYAEFDDVSVTLDTSIRQGQLVQDANMESPGTGSWATITAGTITKDTTSPHGGSQNLRIARSTNNNPSYAQGVLVVGKTYRITGWFKGDGSASPRISQGGSVIVTGTSSNSWQQVDVTFIANTGDVRLLAITSTGSQYAEFDDFSLTESSPLVGIPTNGVTVGSSTGSGGHLTNAYTFDGTNDFVNIYSTDLNSAFNPSEGTLVAWAKVSGSGIWTDGTTRTIVQLLADGSNYVSIQRGTINNRVNIIYSNTGAGKSVAVNSLSSTGWIQYALTWSKSSDQVIVYINGAQSGSTQTGLGTWLGNLTISGAVIGATATSATNPWSGQINDVRLYNRALTATEVSNLYSGVVATRDTGTKFAGSASAKLVAQEGYVGSYTQSVNVGDANSYNLSAYAYTTGSAVTSSDVELFYNGSTISTTYTSVGGGWYKLTGTITGANASRDYGVIVKSGKTVYVDDMSLNNYTTGTLTSSIFDTGQGSNWGTLTYNATTPANTSVTVKARTSNNSSMSGATAFSSCSVITSGSDISSNNCVTDTHRYIQYFLTLDTTSNLVTPTFSDISIAFTASDTTAPSITLTALSPDPNTDNTPTLSGTATDAAGTVAAVQFQMDSPSGSWSACTANDGLFNGVSEAFSCTAATLTDGSHIMYVRATDSNGNTTGSGFENSDPFTIDTVAPSTPGTPSTTTPTSDTTPTWAWAASTDSTSGLAANPYTVQWSQSPAFASGVSFSTSATNSFTHTTPLIDGTWYFRVKVVDVAGNESSHSSNGSVQINTGAPSGTVTISSGNRYTNTRQVTLALTASSGFFFGTSNIQMKISNLPDLSDGVYEPFTASKSWMLPSGDGTKTVYVQFKDNTDNESGAYTDTIVLDTTAPTSFDLIDPGQNTYTNNERSTFRWRAATNGDATSGLSKYKLEIDNGSRDDFTIDNISPSRITNYEALNYVINYENFNDSDNTNNYISVTTRSSILWGLDHNDGKLKEGKRNWKVVAVDNAGNETSEERTVFLDRTSPNVAITQINDRKFTSNSFATTDNTPTIYGKITDPLAIGDGSTSVQDEYGPKVASGPKQVEIKVERKEGSTYRLITLYTLNTDKTGYLCDNIEVTDNSKQKCDKYLSFEYTPKENLAPGIYKITLTGKDKADNTSSETSFTLNVTTLDQITSTEEKQIITEGLKDIPEKQQEEVKKDLEITKPNETPQPNLLQQTGDKITQGGKSIVDATGNFITELFTGIGSGIKTTVRVIGDGIAFAFTKTGQGLGYVGNGIATTFNNASYAVGQAYTNLANQTSGVVRNTLIAIGNGVGATGSMIGNTSHAVADGTGMSLRAVKGNIAHVLFAIGERTQDVSDSTGFAIVKFGYIFVNEPTKIYDVKVTALSSTSAKVSWETNHPANGKVNYGLDRTYPFELQTEKRTTHHEFILTKLRPDTTYHFEVMSQNKNYVYDANREFKTPPKH